MQFNAADATERKKFWPGQYVLEVHEAEERTSSSGNPMIALVVKGESGLRVRDYLVGSPAATWKIRQFCDAAGLQNQFQSGRLSEEDVLGRRVLANLELEPEQPGSTYERRLTVT